MIEKICSHCRTTLLVGLIYCPGCLQPIDSALDRDSGDLPSKMASDLIDDGVAGADSFFVDIETAWANVVYPLKWAFCRLFRLSDPLPPPSVPLIYRAKSTRTYPSALTLSTGYTRVVCPKCQNAQRAAMELSPSDVVTCEACFHTFPGSFAAEFRKGADLECARCNVTTFCVTGLKITACPNCRYSSQKVSAKVRLKPKIVGALAALVFLGFFANAIVTKTTTHFLVGFCVAVVSSMVGFVTLAALGY